MFITDWYCTNQMINFLSLQNSNSTISSAYELVVCGLYHLPIYQFQLEFHVFRWEDQFNNWKPNAPELKHTSIYCIASLKKGLQVKQFLQLKVIIFKLCLLSSILINFSNFSRAGLLLTTFVTSDGCEGLGCAKKNCWARSIIDGWELYIISFLYHLQSFVYYW